MAISDYFHAANLQVTCGPRTSVTDSSADGENMISYYSLCATVNTLQFIAVRLLFLEELPQITHTWYTFVAFHTDAYLFVV